MYGLVERKASLERLGFLGVGRILLKKLVLAGHIQEQGDPAIALGLMSGMLHGGVLCGV